MNLSATLILLAGFSIVVLWLVLLANLLQRRRGGPPASRSPVVGWVNIVAGTLNLLSALAASVSNDQRVGLIWVRILLGVAFLVVGVTVLISLRGQRP